ncbi:lytic murein transglycosylase [Phaeovulum sp.]|uniref:lytic murein transglycosylase n=1 Tax=Phaeovulum sp. TaxID=2934796 RepID=UPI00272F2AF9|nr:lytic murein transglycosylase [Phaeovulum sp.]MDP1668859.1 lytic murein transglycosylase [Phaeovulum sp.]MDZ4118196.1 lytic murein transglycosylase [Phaeovulum sp.]
MHPFTATLAAATLGLAACGATAQTPIGGPMPNAPTAAGITLDAGLQSWIAAFSRRAEAAGIRRETLVSAFRGVHYDATVIGRDRRQNEFDQPIWDYLDTAVSATRIKTGQTELAERKRLFDALEARYGVEREILAAIWGMETNFGRQRGGAPIIPALATLAFDGRRGDFFEAELLAALKIIDAGEVDAAHLVGSWAGAMGHTQFIPTSYLAYAQDFTGDGKRDIWGDNPADALASTAAYLARAGWVKGQPWGVEVVLPEGFPYAATGKNARRAHADWLAMGVRLPGGGLPPDHGIASVLLPAGARGPAYLIYANFFAIAAYNTADAYVIGTGHLADRMTGGGAFTTGWPRGTRLLNLAERVELQTRLTAAGFDTKGTDGKIGPNTTAAISAFQRARGMLADGYPTEDLLKLLR